MARKTYRAESDDPTQPDWPTMRRGRLANGMQIGVDNSVWYYAKVPMASMPDATTEQDKLDAAQPIINAVEALASMSRVGPITQRRMNSSEYREVHALSISIPRTYVPDPRKQLADFISYSFPDRQNDQRLMLMGVRLRPSGLSDQGGIVGATKLIVNATAEALAGRGANPHEFEADLVRVKRAFTQSGLIEPTAEEIRLMDSWWSLGHLPDTPFLPHDDHMHVFMSNTSMKAAQRLVDDEVECDAWPKIRGHHTISVASVSEFDFEYLKGTDAKAQWAISLFDQQAMAISARAKIEPAKITRTELRRNRRRFQDDLNERYTAGKLSRAEEEETAGKLASMEEGYSTGGLPTLVETSVLAAFSGKNSNGTYDASDSYGIATMATMGGRQSGGLLEMMMCSGIRANPNLHDVPVQLLACAGMQSLSQVGDEDGAVLGFTERDSQEVRLSPTAAASKDGLPMMAVLGATGSGKLLSLSTELVTPTGYVTMGDVKVGDDVIGRDGLPTKVVYKSPVNEMPNLYRITFSDGQTIEADHDHQWVVSDFNERNGIRKASRLTAIENWELAQQQIDRIESAAQTTPHGCTLTVTQLFAKLGEILGDDLPWSSAKMLREGLDMVECPYEMVKTTIDREVKNAHTTKVDPVVLYPTADLLEANLAAWQSVDPRNEGRWASQIKARRLAACRLLEIVDPGSEHTLTEVTTMLNECGAGYTKPRDGRLGGTAEKAGIKPRKGARSVTIPRATTITKKVRVYDLQMALTAIAQRLREQYSKRPATDVGEHRMTTGEMLAEGVRLPQGHARFAVQVSKPLELPEADLPVAPYTMGAWLGDGSTNSGGITGIDPDILDEIRSEGYVVKSSAVCTKEHYISGLVPGLRNAGVLSDKHIPMLYLRASFEQRLSVLQGLMDTDGTINRQNGSCELSLSDPRLAADALDLIRSLGIKASATVGKAGYRDSEGVYVPCKDRTRIKFVTTLPVFRLARKLSLLPTTLRETTRWNYIEKIEAIESTPGACIQVENSDATYLVKNYLPTSNTMVLLWIASQFAQMRDPRTGKRRPNIIIDLKQESDHSGVVKATGGRVISLDDLTSADGIFDPLRFAVDPESGVDMAANMLLNVNPWGPMKSAFETAIHKALMVGVAHGATCIGEALRLAQEHDPSTPEEMVEQTFRLAESSHHFRACFGIDGSATEGLRVADGLTLIKLGKSALSLPGVNDTERTMTQRVSVALVQMMVFGSAISLTGRGGVLHLDEAWMFLLGEAKANVEQLGRLARSQGVLPILYTQRCTDLIKAELKGYISRGLILHLKDEDEARAACELYGLEGTPERISRIRASRTIGQSKVPNLLSMQSLRDPETGESIRGSIGIHVDLYDRAAPLEIVLPKTFLELASTNPDDIAKREERRAAGLLQGFDYDPNRIESESEWQIAPIGRYTADVDHSVFARRGLLFGRATKYGEIQGTDFSDVAEVDPWIELPVGTAPSTDAPEDIHGDWEQGQGVTADDDDWDSVPEPAASPLTSSEPETESWGSSPDAWADLEVTR